MNNQWLTIEQIGGDVVLKECSREAVGEIEIPENITYIADDAFEKSNVTIKNLPEGLKAIGKNAFASCSFYKPLVNLPESLEKIGEGAFARTNIKGLYIPASVTQIDGRILPGTCKLVIVDEDNSIYDSRDNCNAIIETATGKLIEGCDYADIPYGVTEIGEYAFAHRALMKIDLPDTLTTIGENAFFEITCPDDTVVEIPSSVKEIGDNAFYIDLWGSGLKIIIDGDTDIKLGTDITYSLGDVEVDNEQIRWTLENVRFSDGVAFEHLEEIPSNCLRYSIDQDLLEGLAIPANVKHICEGAFEGCTHLERVTIFNPDVKIDSTAFKGCLSLVSIEIDHGQWDAIERDDVFFYANPSKFIVDGKLNVPDGVEAIPNSAFKDCLELTEVIIPESVHTIEDEAFSGCANLKKIIVPESVSSVANNAFEGCNSVVDIIASDVVKWKINPCAFIVNGKLDVPEGVRRISRRQFKGNTELTDVVIPTSVYSIESHAFADCKNLKSIYIPNNDTDNWLKCHVWSDAFDGCGQLSEIDVPYMVRWECFAETIILQHTQNGKSTVPGYIAKNAGSIRLNGCKEVESIELPKGIRSLHITNCPNLKQVIYQGGCRIIVKDCPQYEQRVLDLRTSNLKQLTVENLSGYDNGSITNVILPESAKSIGHRAFNDWRALREIDIPKSVQKVAKDAFKGCTNLKTIRVHGTLKVEWTKFDECNAAVIY